MSDLQLGDWNHAPAESAAWLVRQLGRLWDKLDALKSLLKLGLEQLRSTLLVLTILPQLDQHRIVFDQVLLDVILVKQGPLLHLHFEAYVLVNGRAHQQNKLPLLLPLVVVVLDQPLRL